MNLNKFYGFVAEWLTNNENHEFGGQVGRPVEGQEISITRGCDVAHQTNTCPPIVNTPLKNLVQWISVVNLFISDPSLGL
jgi:hypothetical protein